MKTLLKRLLSSRRVMWGCLLFLIVYVGSYAVLSSLGNYKGNVGSQEKVGLYLSSISDRDEWQPRAVIVTTVTDFPFSGSSTILANPAGYLFMPLVYFDRLLIHPTKVGISK
jgi:hypothetical protein